MKVEDDGRFSVYVYAEGGQPHNLPHCHVLWADGSAVICLPTLIFIAGNPLPRRAKRLLLLHLDSICDAWNELNENRRV